MLGRQQLRPKADVLDVLVLGLLLPQCCLLRHLGIDLGLAGHGDVVVDDERHFVAGGVLVHHPVDEHHCWSVRGWGELLTFSGIAYKWTMSDTSSEPIVSIDELKLEDVGTLWDGMDLEMLGRVLRAHLVLEHFMDEWLVADGVDLDRFEEAGIQLMFYKKLQLIGKRGPVALIGDGIYQLNTIRNRFAHNPSYRLTEADAKLLYDKHGHLENYVKLRQVVRALKATTPIDVVEAFAEHSAGIFRASARLFLKAKERIVELEEKSLRLDGGAEALASLQDDDE